MRRTRRDSICGYPLVLAVAAAGLLALPGTANANVVAFVDVSGVLRVTSTDGDAMTVTCTGNDVKVNGADPVQGPTRCREVSSISVVGDARANAIDLNGVTATAFVGLATSPRGVVADGGGGDDVIAGSEFADDLAGGDGEDRISGFRNAAGGRDVIHGNQGSDTLVWNEGDGSDTIEGNVGNDVVEVNGSAVEGDELTVAPAAGGRIAFSRTNLVPFSIDIGTSERLDVNMGGGDDALNRGGGVSGLAPFDVDADGGDGNDLLNGGDAADTLAGGSGRDRLTAFRNPAGTRDVVRGGDDDDTLVWDNGDGSDTIDGQGGDDVVEVNGSKTEGDEFAIRPSATVRRIDVDRTNLVPFNLDVGTTETISLHGNGGDDLLRGSEGLAGLIAMSLSGDDGTDRIQGSDGRDTLSGGRGTDLIRADDEISDSIACDGGLDVAIVDRRDSVQGCEIVEGGRVRVRPVAGSATARDGKAHVRLRCVATRRCVGTVTLLRAAKPLGRGTFAIAGNRVVSARIALNRRGRKVAARGVRASLRIDARDASGNGWRTTHRIRLAPGR
jgi:Ca2+-binding RTX toxin-like protein